VHFENLKITKRLQAINLHKTLPSWAGGGSTKFCLALIVMNNKVKNVVWLWKSTNVSYYIISGHCFPSPIVWPWGTASHIGKSHKNIKKLMRHATCTVLSPLTKYGASKQTYSKALLKPQKPSILSIQRHSSAFRLYVTAKWESICVIQSSNLMFWW